MSGKQDQIYGLKIRIAELYANAKSAYESSEKYSAAAYKSGGSEEVRYKELRSEWSRKQEGFLAQAHELESQLTALGAYYP